MKYNATNLNRLAAEQRAHQARERARAERDRIIGDVFTGLYLFIMGGICGAGLLYMAGGV